MPKDDGYDSAFMDLTNIRANLIEQICDGNNSEMDPISESEVDKAIKKLNPNKAADEFGLVAEQLKHSKSILVPLITDTFNQMVSNKSIPEILKAGIVTPVLKKSKDAKILDNYRGITVTPIISKLFEYTILPRLSERVAQSPLQFGFTEGLSPLMAALLISEARAEVKMNTKTPLFLVTLDSRKAFDVVCHTILLDKLYESGVHPVLWTLVKDMYSGLTSRVKWLGELGPSFRINQGVRQGGILSTFLYKTYIDSVLIELKHQHLGMTIGNTYMGCPTVADDVCLLSECRDELQCMMDVAVRHARQNRVTIHPMKTSAIVMNKTSQYKKADLSWTLGESEVTPSAKATHLGILRSETKENEINIDERMSLARRTMYSLLNTGFHGSNGLNPAVSLRIYQCYVLPRLLYGLEVLPLNITQTSTLAKFNIQVLRRIQSLPDRTATGVVYLLLGGLPIEAEIHKRQLSFLYNLLVCQNDTIQNLTKRQIAVNLDNHLSYYCRVSQVLSTYGLPTISSLQESLLNISKLSWKIQVKRIINEYWSEKLKSELADKSTLKYMDKTGLQIGVTHPVWRSMYSTVTDVKKGITMCRMLTGTYMLQSTKHRFNPAEDPTCRLCALESEDLIHMVTTCPVLFSVRKEAFNKIKVFVTSLIGMDAWKKHFNDKSAITKLIIDCANYKNLIPKESDIDTLSRLSADLCHRLHIQRVNLLQ
ncbi:MAG: reverse transcriptase domain-containing protein [Sedimenticola sp.]